MKLFKIKKLYLIYYIVILGLLLTSCASRKNIIYLQENPKEDKLQYLNSRQTTYRLQPGDNLYIKVNSVDPKTSKFFQSDLPALMNPTYLFLNSYTVNEQGYINFSFVEKMYVQGLTVEEIRNLIQKTVNEYFKEATVSVKLVNFRVTVLGEVGNQGEFLIDKDQISIFQAIGLAKGIQDFGNRKDVVLVRQIDGGTEIHNIDLTQRSILESDYFYLMPNDIVYVKPLRTKSYVSNTTSLVFSIISMSAVVLSIYLNLSKIGD